MTRCAQTDALLDVTLGEFELDRADAAHAAGCADCARAVAQVRRFDSELWRVGRELAPDPMPPWRELAVTPQTRPGGWVMTLRSRLLAGAALTMIVVALLLGGGPRLNAALSGLFGSAELISVAELNTWLDRAFSEVVDETGRSAHPTDWEAIQVETCGRTAIAFYAEKDESGVRAYRWAVGDPTSRLTTIRAGGLAGSLSHAEVAELRAQLPVCDLVLDASISREDALAALDAARRRWEFEVHGVGGPAPIPETRELALSRVVDAMPGGPRDIRVLLQWPNRSGVARIDLSVEDPLTVRVEGAASDPGFAESSVVYRESTSNGPVYFGVIDDPEVRAMELVGTTRTLRFSVSSPGFIVDPPVAAEDITAYRLLNSRGLVLSTGALTPWCGEASSREFWVVPDCGR